MPLMAAQILAVISCPVCHQPVKSCTLISMICHGEIPFYLTNSSIFCTMPVTHLNTSGLMKEMQTWPLSSASAHPMQSSDTPMHGPRMPAHLSDGGTSASEIMVADSCSCSSLPTTLAVGQPFDNWSLTLGQGAKESSIWLKHSDLLGHRLGLQ